MSMEREMDGWLSKLAKKRGGGEGNWQRRWFTLRGDMLCFYNAESEAQTKETPKWSLDLGQAGATATAFSAPGEPPDNTRIELHSGSDHVSLRADSEVEAEMWSAALATQPRGGGPMPQPPPPQSQKSGAQ